jgi:hypothetical protein
MQLTLCFKGLILICVFQIVFLLQEDKSANHFKTHIVPGVAAVLVSQNQ